MPSRAMVVVAGGSSSRFGIDKLMVDLAGRPVVSHTIDSVAPSVDICVVVCRADIRSTVAELHPEVVTVEGGTTRTRSEIAGLAALDTSVDLIGIHDAARPLPSPELIRRLFETAHLRGGAVPVLLGSGLMIDRITGEPLVGTHGAQTPQVFKGDQLMRAYTAAAAEGFEAHDSVEVVERFGSLEIVAVAGDPDNIKVTYPDDLDRVRRLLRGSSRT